MTMSTDPYVGRVLEGRYEIMSKIARGGMATVYRAQDRRLRRVVAIKLMHENHDEELIRRFDTEAQSAARLVSPHIVSVFDQGVEDDRPFIVMEYVPGCTLRHVITRQAPLPAHLALEYLESISCALASAHNDGLLHRDVKPENVLISDRGRIKVADFGLSRAIGAQTMSIDNGQLMGTPSYIPPELVEGIPADERSDVYSTGIVLFEMLTGDKPLVGDSPFSTALAHVRQDVPTPSSYLSEHSRNENRQPIPELVDALVLACTCRDPQGRPENGHHLLDLVRRARHSIRTGTMDPSLQALMHARRAPGATPHSSRATAGPGRDPSAVASGRSISPASIGQPRRPNSSVQTPHAGYRTSHGTHEGSHGGVDLRSGTRSPGEQTAATRRGSDRRRPRSTARGARDASARGPHPGTAPHHDYAPSTDPTRVHRHGHPARPSGQRMGSNQNHGRPTAGVTTAKAPWYQGAQPGTRTSWQQTRHGARTATMTGGTPTVSSNVTGRPLSRASSSSVMPVDQRSGSRTVSASSASSRNVRQSSAAGQRSRRHHPVTTMTIVVLVLFALLMLH